jgi:SNF family Na+-dependent transporter
MALDRRGTPLFDDAEAGAAGVVVGAESSAWDSHADGAAPSPKSVVERPRWGSTAEFILAAVGSAVGLGNLLRFPYMVFVHGGAAFLVPYALAVVFLGIPVLGMELMLGQVAQKGAVDALAMLHARAWGIGVAATLASFLLAAYYSAIMSWVWCFLAASFSSDPPWTDGRAQHFFYDEVLARDESVDDGLGPARWWLVIGLTMNWLVCYACVFAGAESAGKAIWITLPLPYVLLFVLLVKGASLPGAGEGLRFYLGSWDWSKLGDGEAWVDGVAQIFFGLSIACGSMPAYASNCARSENVGRNTWTVGVANSATSVFAGFVVFCFLGHLAHREGVTVPEVAEGGWGLAFVVYPTAMALFGPGAGQFFAACFWLTLLSLGVDSAFALIEAAICAACDRVPWCARNRRVTAALACFACWLVGLPMCTGGGYQVVDVMDAYVSRYTLIIAGLLECVFVGHWYGADRLQDEARAACGHGVGGRYFAPVIKWVVPVVLLAMLCFNAWLESRGTYGGYPRWIIAVFGWFPCVVLPIAATIYGAARPLEVAREFARVEGETVTVEEEVRDEARNEARVRVWKGGGDGAGERSGDARRAVVGAAAGNGSTEMATFRSNEANDGGD